ncbi:MAG: polysaccharide export protein, partial [Rhizobiales bacterium]|nr:polysaccharide export protein [Hyphomicrobiales bacterium]
MIGFRLVGTFIVAFGLLAACGSDAPPEVGGPPPEPPIAGDSTDAVAGYLLGPGDQVRVTVFRHEDLSGEFQLDGEGFFALPLVGEIQGGGRTVRDLESSIEDSFRDGGYLVNPQVSLEVLNYRPFYILGEVNQPGSYPYVNGMTVINAVALAGGYTYRASQGSITVQRGGSNGQKVAVG